MVAPEASMVASMALLVFDGGVIGSAEAHGRAKKC